MIFSIFLCFLFHSFYPWSIIFNPIFFLRDNLTFYLWYHSDTDYTPNVLCFARIPDPMFPARLNSRITQTPARLNSLFCISDGYLFRLFLSICNDRELAYSKVPFSLGTTLVNKTCSLILRGKGFSPLCAPRAPINLNVSSRMTTSPVLEIRGLPVVWS